MKKDKEEIIKFFMRDRRLEISLPMHEAEQIIDSPTQLVKIIRNGIWTGQTINKAEIIGTDHDFDEEKRAGYNAKQIEGPKKSPEEMARLLDKARPDFLRKAYKDDGDDE